jgi:transcriptional regulator with XRE-family HTH domain
MLYPVHMTSAQLIRDARLRAGLTQAQLGERAGKAATAIGRWERGETDPSFATLQQVLSAAGFTINTELTQVDDHDLALIRRCLSRTPSERLDDLVRAVRALSSMAESARG